MAAGFPAHRRGVVIDIRLVPGEIAYLQRLSALANISG
jgi:hypothetical protein